MNDHTATVFIAEDNPILLQGLGRALTASGYEVQTAADGASMLNLLEAATPPPDLLLLDVMMPEMSGFDVLRTVHGDPRWSDLPVVLITAATDEAFPVSALQHGAVDVLTKPFRLGELLARIDTHVRRYRDLCTARAEARCNTEAMEVVKELSHAGSAMDMLRLVAQRAEAIWGVQGCSAVAEEGANRVRVLCSTDPTLPEESLLDLGAVPEVREVLSAYRPVLVDDARTSPLFAGRRPARAEADGAAPELRCSLAVPLELPGGVRGGLLVRSYGGEPPLCAVSLQVAVRIARGMAPLLQRFDAGSLRPLKT